MPNSFITTKINGEILNPFITTLSSFNLMDATLLTSATILLFLAITLTMWFLCVSILVNVIRNTPTRGPCITAIIVSIIMFLIVDAVIVMQVAGGESMVDVLKNLYLSGSAVVWVLVLIFALVAMNIKAGFEKLGDSDDNQDPEISEALARERRIQQILGEDVDPRI